MVLHDSVAASNQNKRDCIDPIPTMDLRLGNFFEFLHTHRTIWTCIEMHGLRPNAGTRIARS
jgi:hypothetical protein